MSHLNLNNIRMKPKLISMFLLIGLIPLLAGTFIGIWRSGQAIEEQVSNNLSAVEALKGRLLTTYVDSVTAEMNVLMDTAASIRQEGVSELIGINTLKANWMSDYLNLEMGRLEALKDDPLVYDALADFQQLDGRGVGSAEWQALVDTYGIRLSGLAGDYGWQDMMLIDPQGNVVYTVAELSDLGQKISASDLQNSGLGKAFAQSQEIDKEEIAVADFAPYAPAGGTYTAFFMAQVHANRGAGPFLGYVVFQMPVDQINRVVQERTGLGETGETFLVVAENGQLVMRSDRVVKSARVGDIVNDSIANLLTSGQAGSDVFMGSTGVLELVAYEPLEISGLHWSIVTTIAVEEILATKLDGETIDYFTKFMEKFSFHDLFLIDPSGFVFYSVTREADYQTNMLDGQYSSSNLGQLVRSVMQTGKLGFADFAPYAPSGGKPSAFVAQPLMSGGKTELIVAVQLPLDKINEIMHLREGMGETGESYLVGPDNRMRSDSTLDPENRSVAASFAGSVAENGVDTLAAQNALAGKHGTEMTTNYFGDDVLSSYGPVEFFDTNYALIAEINEAEVNAPVDQLRNILIFVAVGMSIAVAFIGFFIASSIANPIQKIANLAAGFARGDLDQRIDIKQKDEIGDLATAFSDMGRALRAKADAAVAIAKGDLSIDVPVSSAEDSLGKAMVTMKDSLSAMVNDLQRLIRRITAGNLNDRADASKLQGEYAKILAGVNTTVDSLVGFIDSVPAPFMIIDLDRNIRFVNQSGAKMARIGAHEAVGKKCFDLLKTHDCQNGNCALMKAMESKNIEFSETQAQPNGQLLDISYTGVPIFDEDKKVLGALEVVTDQTAIKRAVRLTQKIADFQIIEVNKLQQNLGLLADGDLTLAHDVNAGDEDTVETREAFAGIATALNQSVEGLRGMAEQMREGSVNITSATAEILASSSQMASTTQEQASAVNQITSTVEEIKASAEQVAQRAQGVADAAAEAARAAQRGSDAADETIDGMDDIRQKVESIAENILSLSEQMQQIGDIIDTVTDIADQSNILALNAAIEAAQAGEAGKGFRVVADEVRSLAEQSRQAAGQVKVILGDIQKATNLAVMATEQGTKGVDAGTAMVNRTAQTIRELAGTVDISAQAAQQIVAGVQQQTVGLDQIAIGMGDINMATQQTAAGAQQSQKAAADLNTLADQLKMVVSQYKL